jgi:hypothetical protein
MKRFLPIALITIVFLVFFWQFLFKGLLPIPSDTIVGLYYPFRDAYIKSNGVPYKNFLITDPVRQQIPWRELAVDAEKKLILPLWNPYNFAGTPLLANSQNAAFYPFNIVFFFLPFEFSWSLLILLQPILAGIFLYLYLRNLKLSKSACLLGTLAFSFSGFFIAWLEWGTVLNVALWLPLILLSIDKIFSKYDIKKFSIFNFQFSIPIWSFIFLFSLVSAFFAGHLQTFFYLTIFALIYLIVRWFQYGRNLKHFVWFLALGFLFLIFISPLLIPSIKYILLSARDVNGSSWQTSNEWFIPWQNLIQFLAPDFFGNPATLNYYGVWNYGEFIGYIGILPLIMAFFALFFRRDKKTLFFGSAFFISLIFALPTFLAQLPFQLNLPFISTSQPTRLLFIIDFSLSILAALGLDYFISAKDKKKIVYILGCVLLLFISLWSFVLFFHGSILSGQNLGVARQNLILPTILFGFVSTMVLILAFYFRKKGAVFLISILFLITVFDLFRFGWKFEAFTNKEYLFPSDSIIKFLQNQKGVFRVMSDNLEFLPPNFSIMYHLQTVDGYDPLYLKRYGELIAAFDRGKPDISAPFDFSRIIYYKNIQYTTTDLLGVKYVLSMDWQIKNNKLKWVFTDGTTQVYENKQALPRTFFVSNILLASSKQQAINDIFNSENFINKLAVVEGTQSNFKTNWSLGQADITSYESNKVDIQTDNKGEGFLVLTDSYYPTWHAKIDGKETRIYLTDYNFRGIIVPKGEHSIEFYDTLF